MIRMSSSFNSAGHRSNVNLIEIFTSHRHQIEEKESLLFVGS